MAGFTHQTQVNQETKMNLYRVFDYWGERGTVEVEIRSYPVVKETKCGYWIAVNTFFFGPAVGYDRWVSKTATKRFAYPTVEEAVTSFRRRKERQVRILKNQLDRARTAYSAADKIQVTLESGKKVERHRQSFMLGLLDFNIHDRTNPGHRISQ